MADLSGNYSNGDVDENPLQFDEFPPYALVPIGQSHLKPSGSDSKTVWKNFSEEHVLPELEKRGFKIYNWPDPKPRNLSEITEEQKQWKQRVDAEATPDSETIPDVGWAWENFMGDVTLYDNGLIDLIVAVARTFASRAKHAFRAGSTWADFRREERSVLITCLDEDNKGIDNPLRIAVWNMIYHRLQEHIWLESSESEGSQRGP